MLPLHRIDWPRHLAGVVVDGRVLLGREGGGGYGLANLIAWVCLMGITSVDRDRDECHLNR